VRRKLLWCQQILSTMEGKQMRGLERRVRNRKIYDQWIDGKTAKELMVLYALSSSTIYVAIRETKEILRPTFFTDTRRVEELYPQKKNVIDALYAETEKPRSVIESFIGWIPFLNARLQGIHMVKLRNATMKKFFTLLGR
jgi:hypothetical protein